MNTQRTRHRRQVVDRTRCYVLVTEGKTERSRCFNAWMGQRVMRKQLESTVRAPVPMLLIHPYLFLCSCLSITFWKASASFWQYSKKSLSKTLRKFKGIKQKAVEKKCDVRNQGGNPRNTNPRLSSVHDAMKPPTKDKERGLGNTRENPKKDNKNDIYQTMEFVYHSVSNTWMLWEKGEERKLNNEQKGC